MLVKDYELEINWEVSCCSQWQSAFANLSEDISHALPDLVNVIKDAKYEPSRGGSLSLHKDKRYIYVYPKMIYIPYIQNNGEAHTLAEWTKDVLNKAYSELESSRRMHIES